MLEISGSSLFHGPLEAIRGTFAQVYAQSIRPDTIHMDTNKVINGNTRIVGNLNVGGDLKIAGNLYGSNAKFSGNLDASTLTLAGGNAKISYAAPNTGFGNVTVLSFLKGGPVNPDPPCIQPPAGTWVAQFGDAIQIYSTYMNSLTRLNVGYDGLNHIIDGSGHNGLNNGNGRPSTLINWYCGNDVAICNNFANAGGTNGAGGVVSVGKNFQVGNPAYDANTAVNIKTHVTRAVAIDGVGGNVFSIADNGRTKIGTKKPISGAHDNSLLTVYGDITTTAIYVTDPGTKWWPDFVFEKDYKLMTIDDVEKYYLQNHHLPDVPSEKEIREKGDDLAKTDAILLQKIEELTLYIVQQQKEIEQLKKQVQKSK